MRACARACARECVCLFTLPCRNPCVCVCVFSRCKNNMTAPVYSARVQRFCEKFHSGLHGLIIIVYVATRNALAKVTSLQGTDEEETERGREKVSGEGGTEDSGRISSESCRRRAHLHF